MLRSSSGFCKWIGAVSILKLADSFAVQGIWLSGRWISNNSLSGSLTYHFVFFDRWLKRLRKAIGCPLQWTAPLRSTSWCWTAGRRREVTGLSLGRLSTCWTNSSATLTAWRGQALRTPGEPHLLNSDIQKDMLKMAGEWWLTLIPAFYSGHFPALCNLGGFFLNYWSIYDSSIHHFEELNTCLASNSRNKNNFKKEKKKEITKVLIFDAGPKNLGRGMICTFGRRSGYYILYFEKRKGTLGEWKSLSCPLCINKRITQTNMFHESQWKYCS